MIDDELDPDDEKDDDAGERDVDLLPELEGGRVRAAYEQQGRVYLVGAGPGDPGLLTVRARELLDRADAVVYDALANPALLPRGDGTGRRIPELYDVGKRGGDGKSVRQSEINALLVQLARDGKTVVRLKGGDPFVFGRGSEEAQALNDHEIIFEVVPGVTAGIAVPAYAGIPVTHRGMSTAVTFVTGHEDPSKPETQTNWGALAKAGGTIVLYMGVKTLPAISLALIEGGMNPETPAAAIQWGTYGRQRTVTATLSTLADAVERAALGAPTITVIGWPVLLRDEVMWFEKRPLHGKRIVVTRPRDQSATITSKLRDLGAEVIEMPATRITRLGGEALAAAVKRIRDYQWLAFTSQNAVEIFWLALRHQDLDSRALAHVKIVAVGSQTMMALAERGLIVDVLPERFVAEGVLDALAPREDVRGTRVLYASAEGARDVLPQGLREMGATVDVLPIYRSVYDGTGAGPLKRALERGDVDLVTFTSASTVHGFVEAVGPDLATRSAAASIGPITSEAAREAGLDVQVEASESTVDGLVEALVARFS